VRAVPSAKISGMYFERAALTIASEALISAIAAWMRGLFLRPSSIASSSVFGTAPATDAGIAHPVSGLPTSV
jgi:hypothetical protein